MKIIDVEIGSEKWLELRLKHACASEAPVVMGETKFMTRSQLLALKKGWQSNPAGSFKQKLFDDGHENESKALSVLEIDMLEELRPMVGITEIDGIEFLSSFDIGNGDGYYCEHKNWNEILAENVRNAILEPLYYWQLEHQLLTAGEDEMEFMVSDGTRDKRVMMKYRSVPSRREDLITGWKQFLVDLEGYEIEARKEVAVARKSNLPSIECKVEGSVVISNLGEYIPLIQVLAEEQMALVLETDQDFADKEAFNKSVKEGRSSLKLKSGAIEEAFESLAEFNGYVSEADKILQKLQSHGEKQVKDSKDEKKVAIKNAAFLEIKNHLESLSKAINGVQIQGISADWDVVIKGKRSLEKMQDAVDSEVANLKIKANEISSVIRKNLDSLSELAVDHKFLFSDHAELVLKNNDDLINLIRTRVSDHKKQEEKRLEAEREKIKAEEAAKAKREAEAIAEAEREKIRNEERIKIQADHQAEVKEKAEAEEAERISKEAEVEQEEKPVAQKVIVKPITKKSVPIKTASTAADPEVIEYDQIEMRLEFLNCLIEAGVSQPHFSYSKAVDKFQQEFPGAFVPTNLLFNHGEQHG